MPSQNNPFHGILLTNPEGEQSRLHEAKHNNARVALSPRSGGPFMERSTLTSPTSSATTTDRVNTPVALQPANMANTPPAIFFDGPGPEHHHHHYGKSFQETTRGTGIGTNLPHTAAAANTTTTSSLARPHATNSIEHPTMASANAGTGTGTGVQFDSEDMERGRSRIKKRDRDRELYGAARSGATGTSISPGHGSKSRSRSRSRSRSLSTSRSRLSIKEEEFLKWTVLRQDPSIRLHNQGFNPFDSDEGESEDSDEKEGKATDRMRVRRVTRSVANSNSEDESNSGDDNDSDSVSSSSDEDEEEDEEESDEEQVSDVEDDTEIDAKFTYDLGVKILPNYCISINEILGTSKPWIEKYLKAHGGDEAINKDIKVTSLPNGYIRGMTLLTKGNGAHSSAADTGSSAVAGRGGNTYILYMDLSSESIYALLYVIGTVITNGDTLYILHWESNSQHVEESKIVKNINKLSKEVLHLFDCVSAVIDDLDVIILSLTHPYPKHLLSEMIYGLKPLLLCCSLSMSLSGLQNFVCSVPTLVIRKKLKRTKRKSLTE